MALVLVVGWLPDLPAQGVDDGSIDMMVKALNQGTLENKLVFQTFNSTSGSDPVGRGLVRADVTWLHQCI